MPVPLGRRQQARSIVVNHNHIQSEPDGDDDGGGDMVDEVEVDGNSAVQEKQ